MFHTFASFAVFWSGVRSGSGAKPGEIEYLVDVEHDHQAVIEPMHTGANARPAWVEIDRVDIVGGRRKPKRVADLVDDESIELATLLHTDGHRCSTVTARRKPNAAGIMVNSSLRLVDQTIYFAGSAFSSTSDCPGATVTRMPEAAATRLA